MNIIFFKRDRQVFRNKTKSSAIVMNLYPSERASLFDYFSNHLYTYVDIDDDTSIIILKHNGSISNAKEPISNTTYKLLSKLINTTRTGSAHKHAGISLSAFLSGILVSFLIFLVQLSLFNFLRNKLTELYQSSILRKEGSQANINSSRYGLHKNDQKKINSSIFGWIKVVYKANLESYLQTCGIDAYLFIRYLHILIFFNLSLAMVIVPVLLPIHIFSGSIETMKFATTSLDILNMSNISTDNSDKLFFHLILTLFVIFWFHVILLNELKFIKKLSSSEYVLKNREPILFIDNIPKKMITSKSKMKYYLDNIFPDSVVEVTRIPKSVPNLRKEQKKITKFDEAIEQRLVNILLYKYFDKSKDNLRIQGVLNEKSLGVFWNKKKIMFWCHKLIFYLKNCNDFLNFKTKRMSIKLRLLNNIEIDIITFQRRNYLEHAYKEINKLLTAKDKSLTSFSKFSVISLNSPSTSLKEISELCLPNYFNKIFVSFDSKFKAYLFGHILNSFNIDNWNSVLVLPIKDGIIWSNLLMTSSLKKFLKSTFAFTVSILVILGWIIPVAFITLISHIPYLTSLIPIISNIDVHSKIFSKLLSSVIPILSLVFITEIVPYIYRWLSHLRCCRTQEELEINTQLWFFIFLFVHIFIVVTISSGISLLIEKIISNPVMITTLLAHELPKSSNFFCSFVLIRGLTYSGGNFIQLKELLCELLYYRNKTCSTRKKNKRLNNSLYFNWGSIYPLFSVLQSIGIIYSVISPIILPICSLSFSLVYFSFKYQFEFQYSGINNAETNGKLYIRALTQLYTGVYCLEISMIGLFTLYNSYRLSFGMFLLFIITILIHYHITITKISKIHRPIIHSFQTNNQWNHTGSQLPKQSNKLLSILNFSMSDNFLIPQDPLGLGAEEQTLMNNKYGIQCVIDKSIISTTGSLHYL